MTDEERKAMEWLEKVIVLSNRDPQGPEARTIRAIRALYQHLSAPKKRWRVNYDFSEADERKSDFRMVSSILGARRVARDLIADGATSVTIEEVTAN